MLIAKAVCLGKNNNRYDLLPQAAEIVPNESYLSF